MKLTVDDLIEAIQSAKRLEQLQADLRNAMIEKVIGGPISPEVDGGLSKG